MLQLIEAEELAIVSIVKNTIEPFCVKAERRQRGYCPFETETDVPFHKSIVYVTQGSANTFSSDPKNSS